MFVAAHVAGEKESRSLRDQILFHVNFMTGPVPKRNDCNATLKYGVNSYVFLIESVLARNYTTVFRCTGKLALGLDLKLVFCMLYSS